MIIPQCLLAVLGDSTEYTGKQIWWSLGADTPFELDFFCNGFELDIDTGWSRAQLLEFQESQI